MSEEERVQKIFKELNSLCRDCEIDPNAEYIYRSFLFIVADHFTKWQKEQMMEHAIEGCYIHRNRYTKTNVLNGLNLTDKVFQDFKNGDKLQLVIIKEGGEE